MIVIVFLYFVYQLNYYIIFIIVIILYSYFYFNTIFNYIFFVSIHSFSSTHYYFNPGVNLSTLVTSLIDIQHCKDDNNTSLELITNILGLY